MIEEILKYTLQFILLGIVVSGACVLIAAAGLDILLYPKKEDSDGT